VQVRTDCMDFISQKNVPNTLLEICAHKCCMASLECMPIHSKKFVAILLVFYAHLWLYDLLKSILYGLLSLLSAALKLMPASSLETHALALYMLPLSQAQPLLLLLSKNERTTLARVRPPTLIDLMRESQESSHLTVEIR
jgi:hypothetical protein